MVFDPKICSDSWQLSPGNQVKENEQEVEFEKTETWELNMRRI